MRTSHLAIAAALTATLLTAPATSSAHHSFAMYDQTRPVVLKGVITQVQWSNPHVIVFARAAPTAGGAPQSWVLELTSPGNLKRIGWSRTSLPVGQPLELTVNPLRDGQRGGALRKVVLADGTVMTADWLRPGG